MLNLNAPLVIGASLSLVAVSMGISVYLKLGFEWSILIASVRAAVQLAVVGVLLSLLVDSQWEQALAAVWILAMVAIASYVTGRERAPWRSSLRLPLRSAPLQRCRL